MGVELVGRDACGTGRVPEPAERLDASLHEEVVSLAST
jgi:hypothetical protein